MKKIIAFGASTSKNSINQKLAEYAGLKLKNIELTILDLNNFEAPIYSIDKETQFGFPSEIEVLNDIFASADGFVVSMAEHNGSYSAAFKNTYDWLSRVDKMVWKNKPMLLMATSPGARGGKGVLDAAAATFPRMGAELVAAFSLPSFHTYFADNKLIEKTLKEELETKLELFSKSI
jgi:NAD(P)H-dependent FMN reductase